MLRLSLSSFDFSKAMLPVRTHVSRSTLPLPLPLVSNFVLLTLGIRLCILQQQIPPGVVGPSNGGTYVHKNSHDDLLDSLNFTVISTKAAAVKTKCQALPKRTEIPSPYSRFSLLTKWLHFAFSSALKSKLRAPLQKQMRGSHNGDASRFRGR